jgi:Ca2+/H+ antiporter
MIFVCFSSLSLLLFLLSLSLSLSAHQSFFLYNGGWENVCMESMFYAVGAARNPRKHSQQTIMSSVSVVIPCHSFDDGNEDGGKSLFQVLGSWHP